MSSWKSQLCGKEGYFLQFETKDRDIYRRVEKLCQDIMDEETGIKTLNDMCKDHFILGSDLAMIPEPCRGCSNHPSNGGSGICNCTLGQFKIT